MSATRAITIAAIAIQNHTRFCRKDFIDEGSIARAGNG
jgi:hypothetical protein